MSVKAMSLVKMSVKAMSLVKTHLCHLQDQSVNCQYEVSDGAERLAAKLEVSTPTRLLSRGAFSCKVTHVCRQQPADCGLSYSPW
jgi:hypothetical protein